MCFNTLEVDSNSDKIVYYDNNMYVENKYRLYFDNLNTKDFDNLISKNIIIISYIIDDNEYYVKDIDELFDIFLRDKTIYEKVYYEENGINIDALNVICNSLDIMNLKSKTHIY